MYMDRSCFADKERKAKKYSIEWMMFQDVTPLDRVYTVRGIKYRDIDIVTHCHYIKYTFYQLRKKRNWNFLSYENVCLSSNEMDPFSLFFVALEVKKKRLI